MSAQAVLSMIAPVLPATPQGPSGADAAEFQGLLAAMLPVGGSAAASAMTAKPADGLSTEVEADPVDSTGGVVAAPGFLTPPSPTPSAPSAVQDLAQSEGQETAAADTPGMTTPPAVVHPEGGKAPPVDAGQPEELLPPAQVASATSPANDVDRPVAAASGPVAANPKEADPALPAETARATSQPAPQLRPLAERVSKPVDTASAGSTSSTEPVDGKPQAPATPSATTVAPSDSPGKPVAPAPPIGAVPPAADRNPVDAPPPADSNSAQTEASASTREHQPSTLSRAALDATVQIAAQIARKLEGRSTRFEIALRPDELGRVDVKLDIDSEGRLAARLAFDNPAAATDLRGRADELRRQLENAGFHLADDAFEFAERDSGSSAFDRGQDARQGQNRAFRASARLNAEIDIAQPPRWLALSLSPSGVDMKV